MSPEMSHEVGNFSKSYDVPGPRGGIRTISKEELKTLEARLKREEMPTDLKLGREIQSPDAIILPTGIEELVSELRSE